jgi:hypothetical protein
MKTGDALPREPRVLKVHEKRELQAGDGKIADHLGDMSVGEIFRHLRVYDYLTVDDQVRDERIDHNALVNHIELSLLLDGMAPLAKLYNQGVFIRLFVQTRLERV